VVPAASSSRILIVYPEDFLMKRFILGAAVAIAAAAAPARAQIGFGLMAGVSIPNSTLTSYANSGWIGGATLRFGAPVVPVHFRIDGTYASMLGKTIAVPGPATEKNDFIVYSGTANVQWNMLGPVYIIGGVGYYGVQQKVSVLTPIQGSATSTQSGFGYNAGIGVKLAMLFVEARWNDVTNGLVQSDGSKKNLEYIPITVGIMF
jgi:hypothetical protein